MQVRRDPVRMAVNKDRLLGRARIPAVAESNESCAAIFEGHLLEAAPDGLMVLTWKDACYTERS